jgi:hypothetical protein
MTAADTDQLRSCRRTAIDSGIEAAQRELAAVPAIAPAGRGGRALLVPELLETFEAKEIRRQPTDTGTLVLAAIPGSASPDPDWLIGTAWIRIGAIERLSRRATDRLARRRVRGGPTIGLQLVRAAVGDAAAALGEAAALLDGGSETALSTAGLIELRLQEALRTTWKLFGASGYIIDEPANLAWAATLLGEVYSMDTEATR